MSSYKVDNPQHGRDCEHPSGGQQGPPVTDTMLCITPLFCFVPAVALPGPPGPPGQPGLPGSRNLVSMLYSSHTTLDRLTSDSGDSVLELELSNRGWRCSSVDRLFS